MSFFGSWLEKLVSPSKNKPENSGPEPVLSAETPPESQESGDVVKNKKEKRPSINAVRKAWDEIRKKEENLKKNKKQDEATRNKIAAIIAGMKEDFKNKYGLEYDVTWNNVKRSWEGKKSGNFASEPQIEAEKAGPVTSTESQESPITDPNAEVVKQGALEISDDSTEAEKTGPVTSTESQESPITDPNAEVTKQGVPEISEEEFKRVIESSSSAPNIDYRAGLREIKMRKGEVKEELKKYSQYQETLSDLQSELQALSSDLLSKEMSKDLESHLSAIAAKTGLEPEMVSEIYDNHKNQIVDAAKKELNAKQSKWGAVGKGVVYIVLGAGAAALSAGIAGAGVIGAVRVLDRLNSNKKMNEAKEKIKDSWRGNENQERLKNSLAAAISLKHRMIVDRVDLGSQEARTKLIDEYLEDQYKAGPLKAVLDADGKDLMAYKDQMVRLISGLDEIDKFNAQREDKLKKIGLSKILSRAEGIISGDGESEKNVSTAIFVGLSIAAYEIPGVKNVLMGMAGYRVGAMLGDRAASKSAQRDQQTINDLLNDKKVIDNYDNYNLIRQFLLDQNLEAKDPVLYQKMVAKLEEADQNFTVQGREFADNLNKEAVKSKASNGSSKKVISGIVGAVAGAAIGEGASRIISSLQTGTEEAVSGQSHSVGGPSDLVDPKVAPEEGAVSGGVVGETEPDPTPELGENTQEGSQTNPETKSQLTGFRDEISNADLKTGQTDSVWRSTVNIFKVNAENLGYKGDVGDVKALESWANSQAAEALNNSEPITDKVFEGNQVILSQNEDGQYMVRVEAGKGFEPGQLARPEVINETTKQTSIETPAGVSKDAVTPETSVSQDIFVGDNRQTSDAVGAEVLGHEPGFVGYDGETEAPSSEMPSVDDSQPIDAALQSNEIEQVDADNSDSIKEASPVEASSAKNLNSIEDFEDLSIGEKTDIGTLQMEKVANNLYKFTYSDGKEINLTISTSPSNTDKFLITKGSLSDLKIFPTNPESMEEMIGHKQAIYNNLPNQNSEFAKELLKDLEGNKKELEYLKSF